MARRHDDTTTNEESAVSWWTIQNVDEIPSPALLVYPDRAEENLRRLIAIGGGTSRLRPHMKTHKLPEIARMHVALGLTRVKCATIAEAEMLASEGLTDVLLAYQPVGPAVGRLLRLDADLPGRDVSGGGRRRGGGGRVERCVLRRRKHHRPAGGPRRRHASHGHRARPGAAPVPAADRTAGRHRRRTPRLRRPPARSRSVGAARTGRCGVCPGARLEATRSRPRASRCRASSWAARRRCPAMRRATSRTSS